MRRPLRVCAFGSALIALGGDDANAIAKDAGGHLATIANASENAFVAALAVDAGAWPGTPGPWLGGFQPPGSFEPDGGWSWVTGEPFGFTQWNAGEPNNEGNENYLGFYNDRIKGTWNDFNASDPDVTGYVVEFE